ncbi:hypothetical protein DdX_13676 [Ditylenchus destructor]|uniref:Uncharacterized protein n=1 Tax=Ditylenchus destructor TaxID=166010 RepID=A0AAD4MUW5_9BILA|nr:hypothetical protein DdX_13676 [Ditylenchus destructor]
MANNLDNNICSTLSLLFPYGIENEAGPSKASTNYFDLDELFPQSSQADVDDEIQLLSDEEVEQCLTSSTRYSIPSHSRTRRVIDSRKNANLYSHFADNELGDNRETYNSTLKPRELGPLVQLRKYANFQPKHSEIENEKIKRLAEIRNRKEEELVQAYKAKRKEREQTRFNRDPEAQAKHRANHRESQKRYLGRERRAKLCGACANSPTNETQDLPGCSKSPPPIIILHETVTNTNPTTSTNEPELIILEEEPPVKIIHKISARSVTEGTENMDIGHEHACTMEMEVVDEPIAKISDSISARSITEGPENEGGCQDNIDWDEITILPANLADENVLLPNTLRKTTSNRFSNEIESMRLNEMRKRKNDEILVVWMGNNTEKRMKSQQERRTAITEKVNSETLQTNTVNYCTNAIGSLPECSKSPPDIVDLDEIVPPTNNLPEIFDVEDEPNQLTSNRNMNTRRTPSILARKVQKNSKATSINFDEFSTPANIETNQVMATWRKQLCIEEEPVMEASEEDKKNSVKHSNC